MLDRDAALGGELDDRFGAPLDDELIADIAVIGFLGEDQAAETGWSTAEDDGQGDIARGEETPRRALDRLTAGARLAAGLSLQLGEALLYSLRRRMLGAQLRARRMRAAGVVLVAVLVSVGAGIGLRSLLPPKRVPQQTVAAPVALPAPTRSVLVARQSVARGGIVTASDIAWQPWPTDRIRPSYIVLGTRNAAEFYGFVARVPLASGEPLSEDKIVSVREHGSLTAMLRPGMRAVSVGIGPETAASGLILPGDDIDVLFAMPIPAYDPNGSVSSTERAAVQTVLRNIHVLAVDQMLDAPPGRAIVGATATVEVTPKEAEIMTLANEMAFRGGMLVLTLKSLVRDGTETAAAGPTSMLDSDISKLLPNRPVTMPGSGPDALGGAPTVMRRSAVLQMQAPPPGS